MQVQLQLMHNQQCTNTNTNPKPPGMDEKAEEGGGKRVPCSVDALWILRGCSVNGL